jgi:AmmeMemoRadiSam system protein A
MERLALGELERLLASGGCELCGGWPVLYGLDAARGAGATTGRLFRYGDSGAVNGDLGRVVGYAAMGFYARPLTATGRADLLALARQAIERHVTGRPLPTWQGSDPVVRADGAAFVTIKNRDGSLRGCIGSIMPVMALHRSVVANAVAAASQDPRFPPVRPAELGGLQVEVTVLSPLTPVTDPSEIRLGVHGLVLRAGSASSVFLPQVPTEQGWNLATYLTNLALKAGLPSDGWKRGRLYRFTAEIIPAH